MNVFGIEEEIMREVDPDFFKTIEQEMREERLNKPIFCNQDKIKNGKDTAVKYINLLNAFFEIKELSIQGKLGINTKGEIKQVKSIEKFAKVFLLRFYNSRPQFYSFTKVNLTLIEVKTIPNGLRFDLEDIYSLLESNTNNYWKYEIESLSSFANLEETATITCEFIKSNLLPLKDYYCIRRMFTYEDDRKENRVEYAELTPEGKYLPDWFIQFKQGRFDKLTRKEQLVAFFNDYHTRYSERLRVNPSEFDYIEDIRPSSEAINVHKFYSYQSK